MAKPAKTRPTNYIEYLRGLSPEELETEIDEKIAEVWPEVLQDPAVADAMATTNAFDWFADEYTIDDIEIDADKCIVMFSFIASGNQAENKLFYGDQIKGDVEAIIDSTGDVNFEEVNAKVDYVDRDPLAYLDGDPANPFPHKGGVE